MTTETETSEPRIRSWLVVHTQPQVELMVRDLIRLEGFRVLLPTEMREMTHARRTHIVERPVFPRYLFCGVPENKDSWWPIRTIRGVQGVLSTGNGTPRPVPEAVITAIELACEHDAFTASKDPGFKSGDAVRIRIGQHSLAAVVEKVSESLPNHRIDVLFDLWGKKQRAKLPVDRVEKIDHKFGRADRRRA